MLFTTISRTMRIRRTDRFGVLNTSRSDALRKAGLLRRKAALVAEQGVYDGIGGGPLPEHRAQAR